MSGWLRSDDALFLRRTNRFRFASKITAAHRCLLTALPTRRSRRQPGMARGRSLALAPAGHLGVEELEQGVRTRRHGARESMEDLHRDRREWVAGQDRHESSGGQLVRH